MSNSSRSADERKRKRWAAALLLAGAVLLLWVCGNFIYRTTRPDRESVAAQVDASEQAAEPATLLGIIPLFLMAGLLLMLLYLAGSHVLVRGSRRHRAGGCRADRQQ